MDTRDIKGALSTFKDFCTGQLGYDKCQTRFYIREQNYEFELNCDDDFQSKADYSAKVEQILISEVFDWETELSQAVAWVWARLGAVMKREERELRFGLNLIGKSLEAGASYRTHVGLEFVGNMKREQEKTMLMLPDRTGGRKVAEAEAEALDPSHFAQPNFGHSEIDDEIPF